MSHLQEFQILNHINAREHHSQRMHFHSIALGLLSTFLRVFFLSLLALLALLSTLRFALTHNNSLFASYVKSNERTNEKKKILFPSALSLRANFDSSLFRLNRGDLSLLNTHSHLQMAVSMLCVSHRYDTLFVCLCQKMLLSVQPHTNVDTFPPDCISVTILTRTHAHKHIRALSFCHSYLEVSFHRTGFCEAYGL